MDETTGHITPQDPYTEPYAAPYVEGGGYVQGVPSGARVNAGQTGMARSTQGANVAQPADGADTSEIRQGIEQTRANMTETVDAIQDRLSPQRLTAQAKDAVRDATIGRAERVVNDVSDTARDTGRTFIDTLRENPIPAALAGIGIGWLFMKVRENAARPSSRFSTYGRNGRHGQYDRYDDGDYGVYRGRAGTGNAASMTDRASQVGSQAQNAVGQAADRAQQATSQVQSQAQQAAGQVADQAQYQAYRARGWFERTMDENPLALGAAALVVGAVAGLAVPETQPEHQVMGPARDSVMQKAQSAAQDTVDKVQHVAEATKNTATEEAQHQNLM